MKPLAIIAAILKAAVLLLGVSGCGLREASFEREKAAGRRAYNAGIPANANPNLGKNIQYSELWLEGYIEAKTAAEAKQ